MLAVQNLVAGTKLCNAVGGAILSQNNNRAFKQLEDIHSATVIYSSEYTENVPVGFGIINRYSPNQLYCSLVSIAKEFEKGFVNIAKIDLPEAEEEDGKGQHTLLKICDVHHSLPDLGGLPQYFTAFAEPIARPLLQCIVDQLVANCFGTSNMELLRNMTIDLYDSEAGKCEHSDELWRDFCGFLVADRFRYCEIDIKCDSLLSALGPNPSNGLPSNVTIHQLTASTRSIFHNYDQMVTVMNRTEYLDFLLDLNSAKGVVAIDSDQQNQPIGYALGLPGRILQCYGEDEQIAGALLHSLISSNSMDSTSSVSMFIRIGSDHSFHHKILSSAQNIRRLRRFHSRIVPTSVKWTKVFCLNVGASIF